jgi:hypothetical protein
MALDIYVGPLARYYSGDWENAGARYARSQGIPYSVVRPNPGPADAVRDADVVKQAVQIWRTRLSESLRSHLSEELSWNEDVGAAYFTDRPNWDGYACLMLLAAHTALPEFERPSRVTQGWDQDPAFVELKSREFRCAFMQIFEVEVWLPSGFDFVFRAEDLAGQTVLFGSSIRLFEQLRQLNHETFRFDESEMLRAPIEPVADEQSFERAALLGLSMFLRHAHLSMKHQLPLKLDY